MGSSLHLLLQKEEDQGWTTSENFEVVKEIQLRTGNSLEVKGARHAAKHPASLSCELIRLL